MPGGKCYSGTHVGEEDLPRTSAYGGIPVTWTTHRWLPEQLTDVIVGAGLGAGRRSASPLQPARNLCRSCSLPVALTATG